MFTLERLEPYRRLVGAQFIGDTASWDECKRHIDSRLELEQERDTLLRPAAAEARPPVQGRLVCTCNQVGEPGGDWVMEQL